MKAAHIVLGTMLPNLGAFSELEKVTGKSVLKAALRSAANPFLR